MLQALKKIFCVILISELLLTPERTLSSETIQITENVTSLKGKMCYKDN